MKIGIVGTGVFSVSLAFVLASKKENTIEMWSENEKLVKEFKKTRKLPTFFKEKEFPENISITNSYEEVTKDKNILFLVTGVAFLEQVCMDIKELLPSSVPVCIGTKGIALDKSEFVHTLVKKHLKNPILLIGGPSFAEDVINLEPVGLQVAYKNKKALKSLEDAFVNTSIYLEASHDYEGIAICGCVKNIYALGAGIIHGLGYHESTLLFYLTSVYKELEMLLFTFNSSLSTFHGLAGFGDLVLTCSSNKSRNHAYGELLGKKAPKRTKEKYLKETTVEGRNTLQAFLPMIQKKHRKAPILECIYKIVFEEEKPTILVDLLLEKK